jgi:hypothetical protein
MGEKRRGRRLLKGLMALVVLGGVLAPVLFPEATRLVLRGGVWRLREEAAPAPTPGRPGLLVLGLDGVPRELLYTLLREGRLPGLERLLGGRVGAELPHAHLSPSLLSVLPASSVPGWGSVFTGAPPGEHGAVGNEFFIREEDRFVGFIPLGYEDLSVVLAMYTEGTLGAELAVPTVYQRLREREPGVRIWVAMNQVYAGADRLLTLQRRGMVSALGAWLGQRFLGGSRRSMYGAVDGSMVRNLLKALERDGVPDVLTVYFLGTDQYAHVAEQGPGPALRAYLEEEVDPWLVRLHEALARAGALEERYVLVTSDHGHTEVPRAEERSLRRLEDEGHRGALQRAGFRVRPPGREPDRAEDHQAVLAYQDGMAFLSLADRSTCPTAGSRCAWERPPRRAEDMWAAAEVLHRVNLEPGPVQGALDMILTRVAGAEGAPFEVYRGEGRTQPLEEFLAEHPRPEYVALPERLEELGRGRHGQRAGDVLLLPAMTIREDVSARFYFSSPHESSHGGPSRGEAEVPLILAHPRASAAWLGERVEEALGERPHAWRVGGLLLELRQTPPP